MQSDEELIRQIKTGNKVLYEELVKRYQDRIVRYISYLLYDNTSAEDIAQETFVKVYINLQAFNDSLKFSSWLYRIAHNEAMNHVKKNRWNLRSVQLDLIEEVISYPINIEKEYEKQETAEEVRKVLGELPVKYREALLLYYIDGKSYDEISDVLHISTGSVGTLIYRGKARMKELLKERSYGK